MGHHCQVSRLVHTWALGVRDMGQLEELTRLGCVCVCAAFVDSVGVSLVEYPLSVHACVSHLMCVYVRIYNIRYVQVLSLMSLVRSHSAA